MHGCLTNQIAEMYHVIACVMCIIVSLLDNLLTSTKVVNSHNYGNDFICDKVYR